MSAQRRKKIGRRPGDVLLIIDAINDLQFPGGQKVLPWASKLVGPLSEFRAKAHAARMPVIYVNDNFGRWRSSFTDVYRHCTRASARGRDLSRRLKPAAADYFILKPMHSAFFSTSLEPLLRHLNARRLILSGIATNLCVLFTAHDAHMLQYGLVVLSDCCAAESDFDHDIALAQLQRFCGAAVCRAGDFVFPGRRNSGRNNRRLGPRQLR